MASEVQICNKALQLIKHSKQISALTEGTKEANACEAIYEDLRDLLLERHTWNFATKRAQLARETDTPAFEWDYQYALPSDFIRATSVHQNSDARDRLPYKLEGGKVLTDATECYMRYVYRVSDPNQMTPSFREALSFLIASYLATSIGQSRSLSRELQNEFATEHLPTAKSVDALQDDPDQLPESSWVSVRHGGHQFYQPGDIAE